MQQVETQLDAALFVAPLLVFVPKLVVTRARGLDAHAELASRYVDAFSQKWLGATAPAEPLLGTPDLQSMADLANGFGVVDSMRVMPVSSRLVFMLGMAALLPMLPLALFVYPAAELAQKVLMRMAGL
jgi:hypothetical protein